MEDKSIKVWKFYEAPDRFRELSDHGGDEDGICLIPHGMDIPYWLERLWSVYGEPQYCYTHEGTVIIWAHS